MLDEPFIGDERVRTLRQTPHHEVPDDEPRGDVRQKNVDVRLEQLRIQQSQPGGGDPHADGDPQRPQDGTPVTLFDVLPPEMTPQFPLPQPVTEVRDRTTPTVRTRRFGGRTRWFGTGGRRCVSRSHGAGGMHETRGYPAGSFRSVPGSDAASALRCASSRRAADHRYWPVSVIPDPCDPAPAGECPCGNPRPICSSCTLAAICCANRAV